MSATPRSFALFETPVGACALVWGELGLVGVLLPEPSAAATRARAQRRFPGARDMEVELAIGLREQGFGVWQA